MRWSGCSECCKHATVQGKLTLSAKIRLQITGEEYLISLKLDFEIRVGIVIMTKLFSVGKGLGASHASLTNFRGGVGNHPTRLFGGLVSVLSAFGVLLAGLVMFMGMPNSASSQSNPNCEGTPTPTLTGTPPASVVLSGSTTQVRCTELVNGLTLTFGSDAKIGSTGSAIDADALEIDAGVASDSAGSNPVSVSGEFEIYSNKNGIEVGRAGTGVLEIKLLKNTKINAGLSNDRATYGVYARHKGDASKALEDGIKIVSEANITVSKPTTATRLFHGIHATTNGADAGATIPITIEVKGGTIIAGDAADSQESRGVSVDQYAKGDVKIEIAKGVTLGADKKRFSHAGIYARLGTGTTTTEGDVTVMHAGKIYADTGIRVEANDAPVTNIMITTDEGSMIEAKKVHTGTTEEVGIYAFIRDASNGGVIKITHKGSIDAVKDGLYAKTSGTGEVTVTTGEKSTIVSKRTGLYADGKGTITVKLDGAIEATAEGASDNKAVEIPNNGEGNVKVTTGAKSKITSVGSGITVDGNGKITVELKGSINAGRNTTSQTYGVYVRSKGKASTKIEDGIKIESEADITVSKPTTEACRSKPCEFSGIHATTASANTGTEIPITIEVKGGTIIASDAADNQESRGVSVDHYAKGDVKIEVARGATLGADTKGFSHAGIYARLAPGAEGDVTITHAGKIYANTGILVRATGTSKTDITVETVEGSTIVAKKVNEGMNPNEVGIYALINKASNNGKITIKHKGSIDAVGDGLSAETLGAGEVMVTTGAKSKITAMKSGIFVKVPSTSGITKIIHRGTIGVKGTGNEDAGIRVSNTVRSTTTATFEIVLGPRSHIKTMDEGDSKGKAILVDRNTKIILEKDEYGTVGWVEGRMETRLDPDSNLTKLTFETRREGETTGGDPLKDGDYVDRRETVGVYDKLIKVQLKKVDHDEKATKEIYEFEVVPSSGEERRLYSRRARLYEVLPSVLLDLMELTPYDIRMGMPRMTTGETTALASAKGESVTIPQARSGVWVRVAASDGERQAETSTTATGFRGQSLAWDVKQTGLEAGLDISLDDGLMLGMNAHWRQNKATVANTGKVEATGMGLGVSLTWTDANGLYVDGQLGYTRFSDIKMMSSDADGWITSTVGGSGLAAGIEVGQRMSWADMTVTPRGGLSWSSVDMDAFDEPTRIAGAGRVALEKGESVQGRVGVVAEMGSADADTRLYASVDVEHEFSSEREVSAPGTRLKTEAEPTWIRAGVGGSLPLGGDDALMLAGDAFYATAGSGNTDFGGGVALTFRF